MNARQFLTITEAIRATYVAALAKRLPVDIAVSRIAAAALGQSDADEVAVVERPAERRRRANAEAMRQLLKLEAQGRGRAAATIVARRMAANPRDPGEVEILSQHMRRLRRRYKKSEHCSDADIRTD